MQLQVIFDPQREIAAIVDVDNQVGWGPAMIGPDAGELLEAWLGTIPYDLETVDSYTAKSWFAAFLQRIMDRAENEAATAAVATPEPVGDGRVGDPALAEVEASAAGAAPPEPAPADTDMGAAASSPAPLTAGVGAGAPDAAAPAPAPAVEQVVCPNCHGARTVALGDPPVAVTCGFCNGTGTIDQPVA